MEMSFSLDKALDALPFLLLASLSVSIGLYLAVTWAHLSVGAGKISTDSLCLFVTAHPDDECMFFAPTILHFTSHGHHNVHLLCVTAGNFEGKGETRKREILASGRVLGLAEDRITVLDNNAFLDGNTGWNMAALMEEIVHHIESLKPDVIFTFDKGGVSGHPNHIAVCQVIRQIQVAKRGQSIKADPLTVYELETVPIYRKYASLLDLLPSLLRNRHTFISPARNVLLAMRAMASHGSQMTWFRWLYILFSRYMMINSFTEVTLEKTKGWQR